MLLNEYQGEIQWTYGSKQVTKSLVILFIHVIILDGLELEVVGAFYLLQLHQRLNTEAHDFLLEHTKLVQLSDELKSQNG